ncbi:4551_t:CDS:2 [Acaulospora colombiana]|uniref:4551_t:CDS:1 n=1 Tax=Acaulospora colombiana TaxID=27376 RepID=A0ACA9K608_9GLOM|nr:4551_t:CDS:2 [Acaulospora colombiana]
MKFYRSTSLLDLSYFLENSNISYTAYSTDFEIDNINGTIPNFNPNNPGTLLISTTVDASSTSSSSTLSSFANITTTALAHKTNSTLSSIDSSSKTSSNQLVTIVSVTSNGSGSTSILSLQSK